MSRNEADVRPNARPANGTPDVPEALELAVCNEELALRSLLLDNLGDGIIAHTLDGHVAYANVHAAEMLGYSHDEFMALPPWGWVLPERRKSLIASIAQVHASGGMVFESRCVDRNGDIVCVEISSRVISCEPWGHLCVSVTRDASARVAAQENMHRLAFYDSLTGLSNRTMLEDRLRSALAESKDHGDGVGVIYIDLDDFKPVNDTHGHFMGDRVLGIIGERMLSCVRETDTIARVGGDEFVALFPRLRQECDLSAKARQLAECIEQPIVIGDVTVRVTASMGLAICRPGEEHDELICRADHAMYNAKLNGRAGWEEFLATA